jgi:hypothetical protein
MSVQDALSRVVGLFGPQATWDPTKLFGNLMVSPNGNVLIKTTSDDNSVALNIAGAAKTQAFTIDYGANYATLYFSNSGKMRWTIYKENTAESGSNAGSNFGINSVADNGSTQTQIIGINRASGLTSVYKGLAITGALSATGNTTLNGNINQVITSGALNNYLNGPINQPKVIYFQTAGAARWGVMCDGTTESGSNAGSVFAIARYNDAGTWVDTAFQISRTDSLVSVTGGVISTKIGTGTGVFRANGDNGTSWSNWSGSSTAALQVDCANPQSAYMGTRWTHWGTRHIAAITAYEGGSTTGTCQISFQFPSNANSFMFYDGGNSTFAGSPTTFSDYRVKTNIESIRPDDVLARLMKVRPTEFDRTDNPDLHTRQPGFIAHELQEHFPLIVKGKKDAMRKVRKLVGDTTAHAPGEEPEGYESPEEVDDMEPDYQSVNYQAMTAYLTAAVQALSNKLDAQAAEIKQLKQRFE